MAAEKDKQIGDDFDAVEANDEFSDSVNKSVTEIESVEEDGDDDLEEEIDADADVDIDDDFDADADDDAEDIDKVVELTSKEQSARSLEIRRALEERMEKRRMQDDLDYLDYDSDD